MRAIPDLDGYFATEDGKVVSLRSGEARVLTQRLLDGYWRVTVRAPGSGPKKRIRLEVHRLVLSAFAGRPQPGMQARHQNGISSDNRASNLEWGTAADNAADAIRHGTLGPGMRARHRRLCTEQVEQIRRRYAAGDGAVALSSEYGIHRDYVLKLARGRNWPSARVGVQTKSGASPP